MASALILASSSAYKRGLLARLQLPFECADPAVDESPRAGEAVAALARRLAEAKARRIAADNPGTVVIGADQAAECSGLRLGKPGTRVRALEQLEHCSGRVAQFHTAVALVRDDTLLGSRCILTEVEFRQLSPSAIEDYVDRDKPFDSAGSFRWEGLGIALFERLRSDDPTALEGLPLIALCSLLAEIGIYCINPAT